MSPESLRGRLRENVFDYEAMHGLLAHYRAMGELDAAWCIAHVLVFLKKAARAEELLHEEHRPRELPKARQPLPEGVLRRHVAHPDQDLYLTCVFGLAARGVAMWRAVRPPVMLKPHKRIDVSTDAAPISRMTAYVAKVLDVVLPELYLRPEDLGDLELMNLQRDGRLCPTMVVLQSLLQGRTDAQLAFSLGRSMVDLYPPHFCLVAVDRSPQALELVLMACLRSAGVPVEGDAAALDQVARELLGRMDPATRESLQSMARRLVASGGSLDVKRWVLAAELTANRVGFLLCGELQAAAQMISQEQAPLRKGMTLGPRDKIKELVEYGISEDYFAARRAIGVSVGG